MRRAAALAALSILLASCGDDPMTKGVVTGGEYHEAWIQLVPITTCVGSPPICTTNQVTIPHPETWTLKLDDGHRKGQRDVEERAYNRCLIGETWPDCEAS